MHAVWCAHLQSIEEMKALLEKYCHYKNLEADQGVTHELKMPKKSVCCKTSQAQFTRGTLTPPRSSDDIRYLMECVMLAVALKQEQVPAEGGSCEHSMRIEAVVPKLPVAA